MKHNSLIHSILAFVILLLAAQTACKKDYDAINAIGALRFSTDTVQFDTIFSSVGSATQYFVVKNTDTRNALTINDIYVAKGKSSSFRLNIDGRATNSLHDYRLAAGDSLFIFVEVTIDPAKDDIVETDSIMFVTGESSLNVKLVAFGRDVTLINGQIIAHDTTWTPGKPILIYNSALIDTFATVTVNAGTEIYLHSGSSLLVKGSLKVNGTANEHVLFTGDRLESYYSEMPGQWGATLKRDGRIVGILGGIHLLPGSRDNVMEHADIKNALIGLEVDSCVTPSTPTVALNGVNIENAQIAGLYALTAHVKATNCVFANCGQYTVACMYGGEYEFLHCTLANYWSGIRQTSQLILNNYYYSNNTLIERPLTNAYFGNCIIEGDLSDELLVDCVTQTDANFRFESCLLRCSYHDSVEGSDFFVDNIYNQMPRFKNPMPPYDYQLDTLSAAKDKGKRSIAAKVPIDQNGNLRTAGLPDLGAFERVE